MRRHPFLGYVQNEGVGMGECGGHRRGHFHTIIWESQCMWLIRTSWMKEWASLMVQWRICPQCRRHGFNSWVGEIPWWREWLPTPVSLPGESHGQWSLVGYSPWGRKEPDTTERLHFHFSLSCIGEGNGNPLQCSCLENPRDGGDWWAAIYGVAQNQTRLKWLSSSSSSSTLFSIIFSHYFYHFQQNRTIWKENKSMNNIETAGFNLTKGVGITCRLQIVLRKTIICKRII